MNTKTQYNPTQNLHKKTPTKTNYFLNLNKA